jgi:thiamine pyrophosphate-dependent acetolactate synthase large subunit-like protein
MRFEQWKDRLIGDVENAAAMCAERDLLDKDNPVNAESAAALRALADRLRALPADDPRLLGLYAEESELAKVPARAFGEAAARCHEAREDLLRSVGFEHGPFPSLDAFFTELRRRTDETITEFTIAAA